MTHPIDRRQLLATLASLGVGAFTAPRALAQDAYPSKGPVKIIVPLPAGGAADASMRIVAASLQAQMKQSFIIDNRPGASFVIGMQAMAQASADGYTLMHINPGMCAAQASLKKIDLLKTLAPVSLMGTMPTVLSVPSSSPYKSLQDLLAAKPGTLNYGSVGIGSLEHLWGSQFSKRHNLDAVHVPFKGMPDASTALAAGEVQFLSLILAVALPLIQKGMIRPLAMIDSQRHAALPNVPTLKELGNDAPPLVFWGGLAAPRGTPAAVLEQLRAGVAAAIAEPDVKSKLIGIGTTAVASTTPQAFEAVVAQDLAWLTEAVKGANLQLG